MKTKLAILLLLASPVLAKQHNVHIFNEDATKDTDGVESALAGRIGATERYALTKSENSDIDIYLLCIKQPMGFSCDTVTFAYGPMSPVPSWLRSACGLVTAATADKAAEMLFEQFVTGSTDEKIEAAESRTTKQVTEIVLAYEKKEQ